MDIHFVARTDVGRVRSGNEDYYVHEKINEDEYVFIVADGMGGHQAGDIASKLASETFLEHYIKSRKRNRSISESASSSLRNANDIILRKALADPNKHGMGTTFSCLIVHSMKADIAHIGDSRIYLIRNNSITCLTKDHSFVGKLLEDGRISIEEAKNHPQRNVLYMSLGVKEGFSPEYILDFEIKEGDIFILCSDGLSGRVDDEQIMHYAISYYPEEAAKALINSANANGGNDNITIQIVRIGSFVVDEDTKPLLSMPSRKRISPIVSLLVVILVLLLLGYLFIYVTHHSPSTEKRTISNVKNATFPQINLAFIPISNQVDQGYLNTENIYYKNRSLYIERNMQFLVWNTQSGIIEKYPILQEDRMIPSAINDSFFLEKAKSSILEYRIIQFHSSASMLIIKAGSNYITKENESGCIKIPNLAGRVEPVFLSEDIFIFQDMNNYYAIKDWAKKELKPIVLNDIRHSLSSRLWLKKSANDYFIFYFHPESKTAKLFPVNDLGASLMQIHEIPYQIPLAVGILSKDVCVFFYSDRAIEFRKGIESTSREYRNNGEKLLFTKIILDFNTNDGICFSREKGTFLLNYSMK